MSENERRPQDELRKTANSLGCDLFVAEDNVLLLDIDDALPAEFPQIYADLNKVHGPIELHKWLSRNGHWHHVIILGRAVPIAERIAWQLALGSDPLREVGLLQDMNTEVGRNGETNCLFKPRA